MSQPRARGGAAIISAVTFATALLVPALPAAAATAVPTPAGSGVEIATTARFHDLTFTFSEVLEGGESTVEALPLSEAEVAFTGSAVGLFRFTTTADVNGATVQVCAGFEPALVAASPTLWMLAGEPLEWQDITVSTEDGVVCGSTEEALRDFVLSFEPAIPTVPVVAGDFTVDMERRVGENSFIGGEGPVVALTVANTSDEVLTIGLAVDAAQAGVPDRLWQPAFWPDIPDIDQYFRADIAPGDTYELNLPEWSGKTYWIHRLDSQAPGTDDGVAIAVLPATAPFVPTVFDLANGVIDVGSEAVVAGAGADASLFPGAEATVTASGLRPGDELQMWLVPDFDYFWFYLVGGALPDDAIDIGTGTVDGAGALSTAFDIPTDIVLGNYQLVIGDPDIRYWPAGSRRSFRIELPTTSGSAPTPGGTSTVTIDLGETSFDLGFPAGTVAGDTTVIQSPVGPATGDAFVLGTQPPVYYHVTSTATFDGEVLLCVDYDPLQLTGGIPWLYHWETLGDGSRRWSNITTTRSSGRVCGLTDSFSPFALGYPVGVALSSAADCKAGGWATSTQPVFRNQGQCVSFFMSKRRAI